MFLTHIEFWFLASFAEAAELLLNSDKNITKAEAIGLLITSIPLPEIDAAPILSHGMTIITDLTTFYTDSGHSPDFLQMRTEATHDG